MGEFTEGERDVPLRFSGGKTNDQQSQGLLQPRLIIENKGVKLKMCLIRPYLRLLSFETSGTKKIHLTVAGE